MPVGNLILIGGLRAPRGATVCLIICASDKICAFVPTSFRWGLRSFCLRFRTKSYSAFRKLFVRASAADRNNSTDHCRSIPAFALYVLLGRASFAAGSIHSILRRASLPFGGRRYTCLSPSLRPSSFFDRLADTLVLRVTCFCTTTFRCTSLLRRHSPRMGS